MAVTAATTKPELKRFFTDNRIIHAAGDQQELEKIYDKYAAEIAALGSKTAANIQIVMKRMVLENGEMEAWGDQQELQKLYDIKSALIAAL